LSGQHSSYWDSNPLDVVQAATSQTGKTVAILGTTTGQSGSSENAVSVTNAWLAQGGIALISWWPLDPFTGIVDNDRNTDLTQLTQPGTAAYVAWYKLMDEQIAMLKQINGPVIYRPFVELNGNWSWWGQKDPATFQLVWQQMHDYYASKGVTNVLWLYNVNEDLGNYTVYYPGADYVDVVSWDSYPPDANDGGWYSALATLGKPIILAEVGIVGDYSALPALVSTHYPLVKAIVVWCQKWALSVNSGASAFMNDPSMIAQSDLPSGLVNP
jgi:mannan endo-1,4-beta-mannosidase